MSCPPQNQLELLGQQRIVEVPPAVPTRDDRCSSRGRTAIRWIVLGFVVAAGCDAGPSSSDLDAGPLPPFEESALEDYTVAVNPDPSTLLPLLNMDLAPVVMVNLLHFHDEAQGDGFEGLSGREAYEQYIAAIADVQQDIGSRVIWEGGVDAQVVGISDPVFDVALLLEYQSVEAFVGFAAEIPSSASAARAAGLEGQWLVAATTIAEDGASLGDGGGCGSWTRETAATATGLSPAQVARLFATPAGVSVSVVELLRAGEGRPQLDAYLETRSEVLAAHGARERWHGELVAQVIGTGSPPFEQMRVTEYPTRDCYVATLADERVVAQAQLRSDATELHWIYAASGVAFDTLP
jgi:uncharacterized protein (DUF1330 family)